MEPLPKSRAARAKLIKEDSKGFVRRMGRVEIDRLILSLSKTKGLTDAEKREIWERRYNVDPKFVPKHRKGG